MPPEKNNPQKKKIVREIMNFIERMEKDLEREEQIQKQAAQAFQTITTPTARIVVCLN